jgi:hypothetical protein
MTRLEGKQIALETTQSQLIPLIKQINTFAIQLEDSTGITTHAQLMVLVRDQHNFKIHEDLLFCIHLSRAIKGTDTFIKVIFRESA